MLFAKEVSVTIFNLFSPPNLSFNVQVLNKSLIILFTIYIYVGFGFIRKRNNFNVANIIFRRIVIAT